MRKIHISLLALVTLGCVLVGDVTVVVSEPRFQISRLVKKKMCVSDID